MELEEMKAAWTALEHKLDESEKLNRKLLRGMAERKSFRKVSGVAVYELIGTFFVMACIPFVIWRTQGVWEAPNLYIQLLVGFVLVIMPAVLLLQGYKLYRLMSVDPAKPLQDNLRAVETYNRYIIIERIGNYIVIAIFTVLFILFLSSFPQHPFLILAWSAFSVILLFSIVITWFIYRKLSGVMRSIKEGFEELKELD